MREHPLADHPIVAAGHRLEPVTFSDIAGWDTDDLSAAIEAFRRSCGALSTEARADDLGLVCDALGNRPGRMSSDGARAFFERAFVPYRLVLSQGEPLLTAYYEPVVLGSRVASERFTVPLRSLPIGYATVTDDNRPTGFDVALTAGRRTSSGLQAWPTRAEIDAGALDELAAPLVWIEDPVDAFFIHVQGSARITLAEGGALRIGFAGRNGHPYTSVGRVMMERGIIPPGGLSMDGMRAFFGDEPELARKLMHENRSYIFFSALEEHDASLVPIGAQGVALTAQRSLAVDPAFHRLGTPIFIDAHLPTGPDGRLLLFRKLMVAQDTGSAIKGAARGDLFWGTGKQAGSIAGGIKSPGTFHILLPRPR